MTDETQKTSALTPETLRRLIILLGVLTVLGFILYGVWKHLSTRVTDVYFVNGLEIPLVVKLGDHTVKVPPHEARRELNVARGQYTVVAATESGRVVDEYSVVVPRRTDLVVVNPLGAAPLFAEELIYYREGRVPQDADKDENPTILQFYGMRFTVREDVAFPFRAPTANLRMSDTSPRQRVWAFGLESGGWLTTVQQLTARQRVRDAAEIARNIALADPNADEAISMSAGLLAQLDGFPAAIEWCQSLVAKFPDSVEAHRNLQSYLQLAGRAKEALAPYRGLAQKNPDSPMFGYLRARMEPPEAAMPLFAQFVEKFPNYAYGRRSYGWYLYQSRRFAEAIEQFEKSSALDPRRHADMFFNHLSALVAVGRAAAAAHLFVHYADKLGMAMNFNATVFYARVLKQAGLERPPRTAEFYLQQEFGEKVPRDVLAWVAVLVGEPNLTEERLADLGKSALRAAAAIVLAARTDPDRALSLVEGAPPRAWDHLEEPFKLLLVCELVTRGQRAAAIQLFDKLRPIVTSNPAIRKFIFDSEESPELFELDLETQAVFNLTRGRRAQLRGELPDKFFEQAVQDDILQVMMPQIVKNWAPPKLKEAVAPAERP